MRNDTIRLCEYAVAGLENTYLDNPDEEPIELEHAIDYCYDEVRDAAGGFRGMERQTKAAYFDTKKAIREEIKRQLLENGIIRLV